MKKHIFSLLALLFTITFAHAQNTTLTFATDAKYPPFAYFNANTRQINGYDIEIATALCKQMKVHCAFKNVPLFQSLAALQQNQYDAVISAMSITPARQKLVNFTNPYYNTVGSFVANSNKHIALANLSKQVVGVERSSTFENYLHAKYGNTLKIKVYDNIQAALLDLNNGDVDVVIGDSPVITNWIHNQTPDEYEIIGKTTADKNIFGDGFGIAVNKNNPSLLNALNNALAAIKANGVYQQITNEYFGNNL